MEEYFYDLMIIVNLNSVDNLISLEKKFSYLEPVYGIFNSFNNITYRYLINSNNVNFDKLPSDYEDKILILDGNRKIWEALKLCHYGKLNSKIYLIINDHNMINHRNLLEMIQKHHYDNPYVISGEQKFSNDYSLLYPSFEAGIFISSYSLKNFIVYIDDIILKNITLTDELILGFIIREFKLVYICEPLMSNKSLIEYYQKIPKLFDKIDDYDILHERIDLTSKLPRPILFSNMNPDDILIYTILGINFIYYYILEFYLSEELLHFNDKDLEKYKIFSQKLYYMSSIFIYKYSKTFFLNVYLNFIVNSFMKNEISKIFLLRDDYNTKIDIRIKYLITKLNQYVNMVYIDTEDMKRIEQGSIDEVSSNFSINELYNCPKVFDYNLLPINLFSTSNTQIILIENNKIVK